MYYVIPYKIRWLLLLIASYYFYICWRPKQILFILLIILSTFTNYIFSLAMYREKSIKKEKNIYILHFLLILAYCFCLNMQCFLMKH